MSTEKQVRQQINRAEADLKQLERKLPNFEKLLAQNRERLERLERQDNGSLEAVLEARTKVTTASEMLREQQERITAARAELEQLESEADAARKADALATAAAAHEAAMTAWHKQAAQSVKAFKAELEKLSSTALAAGAAATALIEANAATGVNYNSPDAPPLPDSQLKWLDVPGVEDVSTGGGFSLPGIATEFMQMSPPTLRVPRQ